MALLTCHALCSLAVAQEHHATAQQTAAELQSAERLLTPAPAPASITIGAAAPADAPEAAAPTVSLEDTAAPSTPHAPKLPSITGTLPSIRIGA